MNKGFLAAIAAVLILGGIGVYAFNEGGFSRSTPDTPSTPANIARPAVKPIPNTFSIMTPEEKAAAEEAARLAAEAASSSATSTASSTDEQTLEEDESDSEEAGATEE